MSICDGRTTSTTTICIDSIRSPPRAVASLPEPRQTDESLSGLRDDGHTGRNLLLFLCGNVAHGERLACLSSRWPVRASHARREALVHLDIIESAKRTLESLDNPLEALAPSLALLR